MDSEGVVEIHYSLEVTHQAQCHAHDHRGKDVVEGGDLKHVAVRVWVPVDIFVLSGHPQGLGTIIFTVSCLEDTKIIVTTGITQAVSDSVTAVDLGEAFYLLYKLKIELPQRLRPSS